MGDPVVHFEIGARDAARSRRFYRDLFGWQIDTGADGYGQVTTGPEGALGGGIMPATEGQQPWVTFYVGVPDLAASLTRAVELGGRQLMGPTPVAGMGHFAVFSDPDGNVLGLFTPDAASAV